MIKNWTFIIFIFGFFLNHKEINASHIYSTEITYKFLDSTNVEVTMKLYKDCGIVPVCNCGNGPVNTACSIVLSLLNRNSTSTYSNIGGLTLYYQASSGIVNPIEFCSPNISTVCTNCGTKSAGTFYPGIEMLTFKGILNLTTIPDSIQNIGILYSECCRTSMSTFIVNGSSLSYYNELIFNRRIINSSPVFTNHPLSVIYNGLDVNYNSGAYEPNGDSLSYSLAPALQAPNVSLPYSTGFSYTSPLQFLGFPNANLPFPFGFNLNSVNGDLRFRPMGIFLGLIVIKVKEWRKDSLNNWVNISTTNREMYCHSIGSTITNFSPSLLTYNMNGTQTTTQPQLNYSVNAGQQLCFVVTGSDPTDSTDLSWNGDSIIGNLGATFTPMYNTSTRQINGPVRDSMQFCWTPPTTAARDMPYYINIRVVDRYCQVPNSNRRSFAIKVNPPVGNFTPILPPTQLTIVNQAATAINISWSLGSGTKSLVIVKANNGNILPPSNGSTYIGNSIFGSGSQIANSPGSYVVYNGTGNSLQISGLLPYTSYFIRVYSFNGSGVNTNYNIGSFASASTQTLPVELKDFTVQLNEKGEAELNWTTATEINNSHFDVERSLNTENSFLKIGMVKGHGNSNLLKSYSYLDGLNLINQSAATIYYRLKQVDYDGKSSYSPIVSLDLNQNNEIQININPNPFKDEINISGVRELSSLIIYEPSGKELISKILSGSTDGSYIIKINSNEKGLFILKINNETFKLLKE